MPNDTATRDRPQPPWLDDDTWEAWRLYQLDLDLEKLIGALANTAASHFTDGCSLPPEQMASLRELGRTHLRDFCLEALEQMGDEAKALAS